MISQNSHALLLFLSSEELMGTSNSSASQSPCEAGMEGETEAQGDDTTEAMPCSVRVPWLGLCPRSNDPSVPLLLLQADASCGLMGHRDIPIYYLLALEEKGF